MTEFISKDVVPSISFIINLYSRSASFVTTSTLTSTTTSSTSTASSKLVSKFKKLFVQSEEDVANEGVNRTDGRAKKAQEHGDFAFKIDYRRCPVHVLVSKDGYIKSAYKAIGKND